MKKILLLAAILYFFIAPFFHQPDQKKVLSWAGSDRGSVWDIWRYGEKNFPGKVQFNYPPVHFYLDKFQYTIASLIGGSGYYEWLYKPDTSDAFIEKLPNYSLANKFTLIIFGLSVGYVLYLLAKQFGLNEKQSLWVSSLWLFNPIVLYAIPAMGQNDVMAILFFLIGWYFLQKRPFLSAVILGLSISIKTFPILWIPFLLALVPSFSVKRKLTIFLTTIFVYFLTLAPFLSSQNFRNAVLSQDLNQRFFIAQINLGFSDVVHIVPLLLGLIVMALLQNNKGKKQQDQLIPQICMSVMTVNLVMLGFSHFHPQWYVWVIPFFALWFVYLQSSERIFASLLGIAVLFSWIVVIFLFQDGYLSLGMLTPLNSSLANAPLIFDFLSLKKMDPLRYSNYAHTVLATVGVMAISYMFQKKSYVSEKLPSVKMFPSLSKKLKFFLILFLAMITPIAVSIGTQLLPIPKSSASPEIKTYREIGDGVSVKVIAEHPRLNRVDVYFLNEELKNIDFFTFIIKDESGTLLKQQVFSGFNTGLEGSLRFDVPLIADSEAKAYEISVIPNATAGAKLTKPGDFRSYDLKVGITDPQKLDSLAIKMFYQPPTTLKEKISTGFTSVLSIFQKMPIFFLTLIIALWFSL